MENKTIPLYESVAKDLAESIIKGTYLKGDKLPTEAKLCKFFNVSRVTIRQSLQLLVDKGFIEKIQGSGSHVIYSEKIKAVNKSLKIKSFRDEMIELNKVPYSKVNRFELIESTKTIAKALNIHEGELVFSYERVLLGDDIPCSLETGYLPANPYSDFSINHLSNSKFEYIEKIKHEVIDYCHQDVDAILADMCLSKKLGVKVGDPLVRIKLITYLDTGTPLDFVTIIFNPLVYNAHFVKYR